MVPAGKTSSQATRGECAASDVECRTLSWPGDEIGEVFRARMTCNRATDSKPVAGLRSRRAEVDFSVSIKECGCKDDRGGATRTQEIHWKERETEISGSLF